MGVSTEPARELRLQLFAQRIRSACRALEEQIAQVRNMSDMIAGGGEKVGPHPHSLRPGNEPAPTRPVLEVITEELDRLEGLVNENNAQNARLLGAL